jgi:hypothetical protein
MSTPALTKTGISEFMTARIAKTKKELEEKIKKMIDDSITNTLSTLVDFTEIQNDSEALRELLLPVLEKYNSVFLSNSSLNNLVTNLKYYGVQLTSHMHQEIKYKFIRAVDDPVKHPWTFTVPELDAAYKQIIKDTRPIKKTIGDLTTLQSEVDQAIKRSGSGKVAYNLLVAMGVDMSGYVEPVRNLPAVVKFSVPVCLVNGDC